MRKKKKTNLDVNSGVCVSLFVTLFMFDLSFLFLNVQFEFSSECFRGCRLMSQERPQIVSDFFEKIKFGF